MQATEASAERLHVSRPNANSQEPPISGKPSICFVSPNAYDAVSGRTVSGHIGGAEVQIVALARGLCDRGHPVSFVTWDEGQLDGQDCDGITVYKTCTREAGPPGLRFFHPRWTKLNDAMVRADADVYLQQCPGAISGQVSIWCRRHRRHFVYLVMSDMDCLADVSFLTSRRERFLFRYGRSHANLIVAQTEKQQHLLRRDNSLEATVVSPCGMRRAKTPDLAQFERSAHPRALWLGRFSREKRIEWVLELARLCPHIEFDLVGGSNGNDQYARTLVDEGRKLSNVHLHGTVPNSEVGQFYRSAQALILTSVFEGFPTVFLEAWSWGLPVVSTIDVDGVIKRESLGVISDDPSTLARELQLLLSDSDRWHRCSRRARTHYLSHHQPDAVGATFSRELLTFHESPRGLLPGGAHR